MSESLTLVNSRKRVVFCATYVGGGFYTYTCEGGGGQGYRDDILLSAMFVQADATSAKALGFLAEPFRSFVAENAHKYGLAVV